MLILPSRSASWVGGTALQVFTQDSTDSLTATNADSTYFAFAAVLSNTATTNTRVYEMAGGACFGVITSSGFETDVRNTFNALRYSATYPVDTTTSTPVHIFFSYNISTGTPLFYVDGVVTAASTVATAPTSGGTIDCSGAVLFNRAGGDRPINGDFTQVVLKTGSALAITDVYDGGIVADLSGLDASCDVVLDGSRMSVANLNAGVNYGTNGTLTVGGTFTDGGTITV